MNKKPRPTPPKFIYLGRSFVCNAPVGDSIYSKVCVRSMNEINGFSTIQETDGVMVMIGGLGVTIEYPSKRLKAFIKEFSNMPEPDKIVKPAKPTLLGPDGKPAH